jgi:regulator of sigma E protease
VKRAESLLQWSADETMAQNIPTNFIAFIIVLGFLIYAHEAGHFFVAKFFKVRVLVFSFGFGKRLFGFRRGPTDYRVSLIPLGGYVRMAGDTPEENQPANPDEFLSKPKWQRFLILLAGPFMNLLIAVAFVAGLLMMGTEELKTGTTISAVTPDKPAARAGLQRGDRILAINGEKVDDFDDVRMIISMHAGTRLRFDYERNGVRQTTSLIPERENTDLGPIGKAGIAPYEPTVVGRVLPNTPAARAGLRSGDRILTAGGKPASEYIQFSDILLASKDAPLALEVQRGAERIRTTLPAGPLVSGEGFRGFGQPVVVREYAFGPAIVESVRQNWKMVRMTFITIGRLVRGEGSMKELSGPLSIARISGAVLRQGIVPVIGLMAMISLQLGVMNLLPIPVLDGGHIMVLLVEGVIRRELSLRVKERIQQVGFAVLAALMIVVLYNDVITNVLLMRKG